MCCAGRAAARIHDASGCTNAHCRRVPGPSRSGGPCTRENRSDTFATQHRRREANSRLIRHLLTSALNEAGFRIGRFVQACVDSEARSLTGSIQASIPGLLALLLGFTFSMSMQRYDNRRMALMDEANTIGTAALRTQLLPEQFRGEAGELFQEYIRRGAETGQIDIDLDRPKRGPIRVSQNVMIELLDAGNR